MKKYIGIDIGGTKINAAIIDQDSNILYRVQSSTPLSPNEVLNTLISLINNLLAHSSDVISIGIGTPGKVNPKTGKLEDATPNMQDWHKVSLKDTIIEHFKLPTFIDNDANAAAWGEYLYGAAQGLNNVVMFTLGTGVGGGVIIEGKILHGTDGKGGELGHIIVQPQGRKCNCGQEGCLEAYSSGTAIVKMAQELIDDPIYSNSYLQNYKTNLHGSHIFDGARNNDLLCIKILEQMYFYLSIAMLDIVNIFAPETILIGGGISKQGEFLITNLNRVFSKMYKVEPNFLKLAKLYEDAGLIGAAFLFKNE